MFSNTSLLDAHMIDVLHWEDREGAVYLKMHVHFFALIQSNETSDICLESDILFFYKMSVK